MDQPLHAFLDGISPWMWLTLAVLLAAVEIATATFFLIWMAIAAAAVALGLAIAPDMDWSTQLLLFSTISLALVTFLRGPALRRFRGPSSRPELNNRAARMIGRRAEVAEPFRNGEGALLIDGVRWKARLAPDETGIAGPPAADPQPGGAVVVRGHEGVLLLVSPA